MNPAGPPIEWLGGGFLMFFFLTLIFRNAPIAGIVTAFIMTIFFQPF